jgi:hypothetical protein
MSSGYYQLRLSQVEYIPDPHHRWLRASFRSSQSDLVEAEEGETEDHPETFGVH